MDGVRKAMRLVKQMTAKDLQPGMFCRFVHDSNFGLVINTTDRPAYIVVLYVRNEKLNYYYLDPDFKVSVVT